MNFCKRCVYHSEIPNIQFNSHGVCSFCETHDELNVLFPGGDKGEKQFLTKKLQNYTERY